MKKLDRSECAVFHLVLNGRWYRMIESGGKREEYRDVSDYWLPRIRNWETARASAKWSVVEFRLGHRKDAPRMTYLCPLVLIRGGALGATGGRILHPEWGEPAHEHFALILSERVELAGGKAKMLPGAGRVCENTGHKARKEKNLRQE